MGSGKMGENILEELQFLLEQENRVITYKFVSKKFDIHVNKAKEYLQTLDNVCQRKGDHEITATYFLSGTYQEPGVDYTTTKAAVVSGSQLTAMRALLQMVSSEHIYSLQRLPACSATVLYAADLQHQPHDLTTYNSHGAIRCQTAQLLSQSEFTNVSQATTPTRPLGKQTSPLAKYGHKQETRPPAQKTPFEESEATLDIQQAKDRRESTQTQPKRGVSVSMFAKKTKSPPKKATSDKLMTSFLKKGSEKPAPSFAEKSPPALTSEREPAAAVDLDSHGESRPATAVRFGTKKDAGGGRKAARGPLGSSRKRVTNATTGGREKKRLRILSMESDSSDSSSEEAVREESEPEPAPVGDTIMPDGESEPEPAPVGDTIKLDGDPGTLVAPDPSQGRNKLQRKQVSKTFLGEDGFMVTKKVYESCSESETKTALADKDVASAETVLAMSADVTSLKSDQPSSDALAKLKERSPHKKKQCNIMSFFKKT